MRRRRFQPTEPGVSLLPFMAVLICTMGTLVVLLMVAVRQAKVRADTVAQDRRQELETTAAEREAELEQRRIEQETFQWRFEQLQDSREKTAADLAERRRQLAHVEDHARRLQEEWKRLSEVNSTLEGMSQNQRLDQQELLSGIEATQRRLQTQRAELEAARKKAEEQPRSYAIVPYDGPHGTNRRPIYIECLEDRVILQPEGIVFEDTDFGGPADPGNPLAASLRAIREHWRRAGLNSGDGEAYPLLIVRPGGANSYFACREAMKSWDDEFGYELISDEIPLAFPPPDPALADLLERTVSLARERQNQLMLALLARPGNRESRQYLRATPSGGGFVVESEPGGFEAGSHRGGGGGAADRRPYSTVARGSGGFGRPRPTGDAGGTDPPGGQAAGQAPGGGDHTRLPSAGALASRETRQQHAGSPGQPPRGSGGFYGGPSTQPANQQPTQYAPSARGGQSQQGMAATPPPGATNPGRDPADKRQFFGGASSTGGSGGSSQPSASLADTRGRNWALPHAAQGATGVTRPIRIVCTADQLTIVPQRGSGQALKVVSLQGRTTDSVDQFVSDLWQHIEEWQMAGPGLFWKPELLIEVAPGGRQRFEQLAGLLEGSGITVKQKTR